MIDIVNNRHNGITEAITKLARQLPSKIKTTKMTIKQPKMRFSAMVNVVLFTNSLLSKNPLM
jgi:hypothetical protein